MFDASNKDNENALLKREQKMVIGRNNREKVTRCDFSIK